MHTVEKKKMPWLWMILGLLIPIFLIVIAFFAAKSDAETKREYDQQRAEIAKKIAQQKQISSRTSTSQNH